MKNIIHFLTLSIVLMAASCRNKPNSPTVETAAVNLAFRATYGGEPLVLNQRNYNYLGNPVRFSKINFYIADLVVINNDGETELSDILFVDLNKSHQDLEDAMDGTVMSFQRVPEGKYNRLRFGVGVPADLNKTRPADYSKTHPLGADNSEEYWEPWNSYIFTRIEGQYDRNGNGFDGDDVNFAYFTGTDRVFTNIDLDYEIDIETGNTTNLNFELDIQKLLSLPRGDMIELEESDPANQIDEMFIIRNNFRTALTLN
ncbi:MAG: MbnP family protein [Bacteroidota bacterium]